MVSAKTVQVRCERCAWAATGVSEDAERTFAWLEQELVGHLEGAHGEPREQARQQAHGAVEHARRRAHPAPNA